MHPSSATLVVLVNEDLNICQDYKTKEQILVKKMLITNTIPYSMKNGNLVWNANLFQLCHWDTLFSCKLNPYEQEFKKNYGFILSPIVCYIF